MARRKQRTAAQETSTAVEELDELEELIDVEDLVEATDDTDADDELDEVDAESNVVTPKMIAKQLGISPKVLRAWLRKTFPRPRGEKNTSWNLTPAQVKAAVEFFTAEDEDESDED